ncbi:hypothetical protein IQ07DRAFT_665787 [Pyrenochaeta sp. DS3sAY3a]|nr:hypothetical protein IQ07DRAFT_665787 [Pyrenochaeta sp. DS3sAY3a]
MPSSAAASSAAKKIEEKRVFAVLSPILEGYRTNMRRLKMILTLIDANMANSEVQSVVQDYGMKGIRDTAKSLLEKGILNKRFLESGADIDALFPSSSGGGPAESTPKASAARRSKAGGSQPVEVRLPFALQHRVMVELQETLEKACFAFAQKHMPDVLEQKGWDCAEAGELSKWPKVLTRQGSPYLELVKEFEGEDEAVLAALPRLRNSAVHRQRLSANETLHFVIIGEGFANLLGDDERAESISQMGEHVGPHILKLKEYRAVLGAKLANMRVKVLEEKARLEREEAGVGEEEEEADEGHRAKRLRLETQEKDEEMEDPEAL